MAFAAFGTKQFCYLDNFLSCIHKKMQLSFTVNKKTRIEKLGIMGISGQFSTCRPMRKNDRHAMRRSKKCKSVIPHVINAEKAFSSISSHHLGYSQGQIISFIQLFPVYNISVKISLPVSFRFSTLYC